MQLPVCPATRLPACSGRPVPVPVPMPVVVLLSDARRSCTTHFEQQRARDNGAVSRRITVTPRCSSSPASASAAPPATAAVPQASAQTHSRSKVVCIGESLFDLISEQPGLPREKVRRWSPYAGGAPCNVATALSKLGLAEVVFVTALGRDPPGNQLYDILKSAGVKLHAVQRRSEPTRDVFVVRDSKGDREFAGFGQPTDKYCDCFLEESMLPLEDIKTAGMLVTGTLGLAYPATRAAMHKAVEVARANGTVVFVDVNWRNVFWQGCQPEEIKEIIMSYLHKADLLKLSEADIQWLLGMDQNTALQNPCRVADHFPNARTVLVTAGEEGAAYCCAGPGTQRHTGFVPTFKVDTVDTTGAGDAFTAGFVYKLMEHGSLDSLCQDGAALKEAVVFASACGALTTTRKGAIEAQPSLEESKELFARSKDWYDFWLRSDEESW